MRVFSPADELRLVWSESSYGKITEDCMLGLCGDVRFSESCLSAGQRKTAQLGWWNRRRTHLETLHDNSVCMKKNCNSAAVAEEMAVSVGENIPPIPAVVEQPENCILRPRGKKIRYGEQLYWVGEWWIG